MDYKKLTLIISILFSLQIAVNGKSFSNDPKDTLGIEGLNLKNAFYFKLYSHPLLSSFSVNAGLGIAAYGGEVSYPPDFAGQNNHMNPELNLGLEYRLTHYVSIRAESSFFTLKAKNLNDPDKAFKSNNIEFYGAVVHDLIPKKSIESYYRRFSPYIYGGIGGVYFDPKSVENDESLLIEDVDTVTISHPKTAMVFPIGIGFKYYFHESLSMSIEGGTRITKTDLLDGFGGKNDPNPRNDVYFIIGAKINIQLQTNYKYNRHLKRK
ncbi:MAG: porin family protein [Flammeovirgaceae bacterium]|nr:porin family protein [Flammeovirgaceae bacterium]